MMIEGEIISLISNVGFPIVAFLLMYYQSTKTIKQNSEALVKLTEVISRCPRK